MSYSRFQTSYKILIIVFSVTYSTPCLPAPVSIFVKTTPSITRSYGKEMKEPFCPRSYSKIEILVLFTRSDWLVSWGRGSGSLTMSLPMSGIPSPVWGEFPMIDGPVQSDRYDLWWCGHGPSQPDSYFVFVSFVFCALVSISVKRWFNPPPFSLTYTLTHSWDWCM